jgi:hypothetical protein
MDCGQNPERQPARMATASRHRAEEQRHREFREDLGDGGVL